jgi:hypothetical protein
LEMTVTKAVVIQRSTRLRHLEPQPRNAEQLLLSFLEANHRRGWKNRLKGWMQACKAAKQARTEE